MVDLTEAEVGVFLRKLFRYLGDDPDREGLVGTPGRIFRLWSELFAGYGCKVGDLFRVFVDGACDEMVVLRDCEFFSTCEHHMLPFHGKAHIGYLPAGRVIGVSKLARLLDVYARRLQIQERIGEQVTEAMMSLLRPRGCGCVLEATHLCVSCRGVAKQASVMVTSSMRGVFLTDTSVRSEFLRMIGK